MRSFENKRVLITGSGRGIGKGIAHRFAQDGAKILLVARSRDELDQTRGELLELASEVRALAIGLTLRDSTRQVVTEAAEAWGGLGILVTTPGPHRRVDSSNWTTTHGRRDSVSRCSPIFGS